VNSDHQDLISQQTPDVKRHIHKAYMQFSQGDIEGALSNFQAAILLNPNCAEIYAARANFRKHKLSDLQGALEDYTQAISINCHNGFFYFWRSQVYQELGHHQKAIEDYNTAMDLVPDGTIYHVFDPRHQ
jgi:tetratricopeptide (TPR) repeat protein